MQHFRAYIRINATETYFVTHTGRTSRMYLDELAREAALIARGHQLYAAMLAERWTAVLHWLGLRG